MHGLVMVTKHDEPDVVFFSGGGQHGGWNDRGKVYPPAAVRFMLEGGTLKTKVLWTGHSGQPSRRGAGDDLPRRAHPPT